MKWFVSTLLFVIAFQANADCNITKQYAQFRTETFKMLMEPYSSCSSSTRAAIYWKAVSQCVKDGLGNNVGGGCVHLVSHGGYPLEKADTSHCEVFRRSTAEIQLTIDELAKQQNIAICQTQAAQTTDR